MTRTMRRKRGEGAEEHFTGFNIPDWSFSHIGINIGYNHIILALPLPTVLPCLARFRRQCIAKAGWDEAV